MGTCRKIQGHDKGITYRVQKVTYHKDNQMGYLTLTNLVVNWKELYGQVSLFGSGLTLVSLVTSNCKGRDLLKWSTTYVRHPLHCGFHILAGDSSKHHIDHWEFPVTTGECCRWCWWWLETARNAWVFNLLISRPEKMKSVRIIVCPQTNMGHVETKQCIPCASFCTGNFSLWMATNPRPSCDGKKPEVSHDHKPFIGAPQHWRLHVRGLYSDDEVLTRQHEDVSKQKTNMFSTSQKTL